jgi:hypothetical protein
LQAGGQAGGQAWWQGGRQAGKQEDKHAVGHYCHVRDSHLFNKHLTSRRNSFPKSMSSAAKLNHQLIEMFSKKKSNFQKKMQVFKNSSSVVSRQS